MSSFFADTEFFEFWYNSRPLGSCRRLLLREMILWIFLYRGRGFWVAVICIACADVQFAVPGNDAPLCVGENSWQQQQRAAAKPEWLPHPWQEKSPAIWNDSSASGWFGLVLINLWIYFHKDPVWPQSVLVTHFLLSQASPGVWAQETLLIISFHFTNSCDIRRHSLHAPHFQRFSVPSELTLGFNVFLESNTL